jgi:hypothetical protein
MLAVGDEMECHDAALSFHRVQAQRPVWSDFTGRPPMADCPSISSHHSLGWSRANWRGLIIDNNNAQPICIQLWQMNLNRLLILQSDANSTQEKLTTLTLRFADTAGIRETP